VIEPLYILHGALGSAHQFDALQEALTVPSAVLTFVGHGNVADTCDDWSVELFSKQLEEELQSRDSSTPVSIFGYSMGGYVAMDCALRRPDLIARIVTLGTKFDWSVEGAMREIQMLDPDMIQSKVPAFGADLARRHGAHRWRIVLAKTADLMTHLGAQPTLSPERCSSLTIPVRYGIGDRDQMVSVEETIPYFRSSPGAELHVLPNTRHPIERVSLAELVRHIETFL